MTRALAIFFILLIIFGILSAIVAVFARGLSRATMEQSLRASMYAVIYGFLSAVVTMIPASIFTERTEQTLAVVLPVFLATGVITIIVKLGVSWARFLLLIPVLLLFREAILNIAPLGFPGREYIELWSLYSWNIHF